MAVSVTLATRFRALPCISVSRRDGVEDFVTRTDFELKTFDSSEFEAGDHLWIEVDPSEVR